MVKITFENVCNKLERTFLLKGLIIKIKFNNFHVTEAGVNPGTLVEVKLPSQNINEFGPFHNFKSLKILDLSDNILKFLREIEPLFGAPVLESLILKGNPVTSTAGYRSYVIAGMPMLKTLDEVPITNEERVIAAKEHPQHKDKIKLAIKHFGGSEELLLEADKPKEDKKEESKKEEKKEESKKEEKKEEPVKKEEKKEDSVKKEEKKEEPVKKEEKKEEPLKKEEKKLETKVEKKEEKKPEIKPEIKQEKKVEKKEEIKVEPPAKKEEKKVDKKEDKQPVKNEEKKVDKKDKPVKKDEKVKKPESDNLFKEPPTVPAETDEFEPPKKPMLSEDDIFGEEHVDNLKAASALNFDDSDDEDIFKIPATRNISTSTKTQAKASTKKEETAKDLDFKNLNIDDYISQQNDDDDDLFS